VKNLYCAMGQIWIICKFAVLNSLGSPASQRVYEYAIDQFITW